ncbi:MAG: AbrB family transcriptional regulator [Chthoniobacteraceae bacterium]|nr:AbrB family transcriptional regulator [Chthoniobacteraceae bacterium]
MNVTTITERGQISIPAELRREMHLTPGKTVMWEKVSATECRLLVQEAPKVKPDPMAAIGFAQRHGLAQRTTAQWMKMLREGEED